VELYEHIRESTSMVPDDPRGSAEMGVHRRKCGRLCQCSAARAEEARAGATEAGPALPFIDAILEADRRAPRKQRHTAHRIWTRLRRRSRRLLSASPRARVCAPAQAGDGLLDTRFSSRSRTSLATKHRWTVRDLCRDRRQQRKTYIFCMRSMASGAAFHRAYPTPRSRHFLRPTSAFRCLAGSFAP